MIDARNDNRQRNYVLRLDDERIWLDTRIHLVCELEQLPPTPAILALIAEAKAGDYHDLKSTKYALPKAAAYVKLRAAGLDNLAERLAAGEFDEFPDAEDEERLPSMSLEDLNDL